MRILLIGEYSNVHWTLAQGLRQLGHTVTVLSNGDFWKDYPRDLSAVRKPGKWGGVRYLCRICSLLPRLRGYDVVQFINPMFVELMAKRVFPIYRYLRRHNGCLVLGAFGMDYYWVHENLTRKPLRYGDFNIADTLRDTADTRREIADWIGTAKERLNTTMANECQRIVAGLYEYWACYHPLFPDKTKYIPFPIKVADSVEVTHEGKLKMFIGINKERSSYKGTDIMLAAAQQLASRRPDLVELRVVESVPFATYRELMNGSDVILDQLYSYTPSMNPLEAMAHGIICVGGGEPECYDILHEDSLRPIINVLPTYESVYQQLEWLALHPEKIVELKRQSVEFVRKHHDYLKVARQYAALYEECIAEKQQTKR